MQSERPSPIEASARYHSDWRNDESMPDYSRHSTARRHHIIPLLWTSRPNYINKFVIILIDFVPFDLVISRKNVAVIIYCTNTRQNFTIGLHLRKEVVQTWSRTWNGHILCNHSILTIFNIHSKSTSRKFTSRDEQYSIYEDFKRQSVT